MKIYYTILPGNQQKISVLLSGKIDKGKYLASEKTLPPG